MTNDTSGKFDKYFLKIPVASVLFEKIYTRRLLEQAALYSTAIAETEYFTQEQKSEIRSGLINSVLIVIGYQSWHTIYLSVEKRVYQLLRFFFYF